MTKPLGTNRSGRASLFRSRNKAPQAQRPIVVPDDQSINIELLNEVPAYLSMDGQTGVTLGRGDRVQVKQSSSRVLLVRNPNLDFFGILRAKLRWGER